MNKDPKMNMYKRTLQNWEETQVRSVSFDKLLALLLIQQESSLADSYKKLESDILSDEAFFLYHSRTIRSSCMWLIEDFSFTKEDLEQAIKEKGYPNDQVMRLVFDAIHLFRIYAKEYKGREEEFYAYLDISIPEEKEDSNAPLASLDNSIISEDEKKRVYSIVRTDKL
ncbi:MAG: hypothetical protein PHN72_03005 [Bacilli bacterium]|nr:hypothetical protein [Bacilli bacterium]